MGADRIANTQELVRAPGGLLERLQRRVTLKALRESSSSFGTEFVESQTASTKQRRVSMGADTKANTRGGGALEGGDLRLLEDSSEHGGALNSDVVAKETAKAWVRSGR